MPQYNKITDIKTLLHLYSNGAVFTAIDTETTGLSSTTCRIIEIGAVKFSKNGILDKYNTLINPCCPVPKEAQAINNITDAMLIDCPIFEKIAPDFLSFTNNSILIAHNAGFDIKFINAELSRINFPSIKNNVVDTVKLSKNVFPNLPNHKLQTLANHFNFQVKNAHRAYDDAHVCMNLFITCLNGIH